MSLTFPSFFVCVSIGDRSDRSGCFLDEAPSKKSFEDQSNAYWARADNSSSSSQKKKRKKESNSIVKCLLYLSFMQFIFAHHSHNFLRSFCILNKGKPKMKPSSALAPNENGSSESMKVITTSSMNKSANLPHHVSLEINSAIPIVILFTSEDHKHKYLSPAATSKTARERLGLDVTKKPFIQSSQGPVIDLLHCVPSEVLKNDDPTLTLSKITPYVSKTTFLRAGRNGLTPMMTNEGKACFHPGGEPLTLEMLNKESGNIWKETKGKTVLELFLMIEYKKQMPTSSSKYTS